MFCPKCGSLLKPKELNGKKVLACSCGYINEKKQMLNLSHNGETKEISVIEKEEDSTRMIVDEECPKCGHDKAYYWTQQEGPSDEPEDQVYRCVKCGHGWREKY